MGPVVPSAFVWKTVCGIVFEELSQGRGVRVPGLGSFTVDDTGRGGRRPVLTLGAQFEKLGVKPPAAKPRAPAPTHLLPWHLIAEAIGSDHDLARRALDVALAGFVNRVGAVASGPAGGLGQLQLELGRCGRLTIVKCGAGKAGSYPRVEFSCSLIEAVRAGQSPDAPPSAPSSTALDGDLDDAEAEAKPGAAATTSPIGPVDAAAAAALAAAAAEDDARFVTLGLLKELGVLGGRGAAAPAAAPPPAAAAPPPPPPPAEAAAAVAALASSVGAADTAALAAAAEYEPPAHALPLPPPEMNEWVATKRSGRGVLSARERTTRVLLDNENRAAVRARAAKSTPHHLDSDGQKGVLTLLHRAAQPAAEPPSPPGSPPKQPWHALQPPSPKPFVPTRPFAGKQLAMRYAAPKPRSPPKPLASSADAAGLPRPPRPPPEQPLLLGEPAPFGAQVAALCDAEAALLLQRKRELEQRIEALEAVVDAASISTRASRASRARRAAARA